MKILILGGTGNIGKSIVKELYTKGADISILCRNQKSIEKAESLKAKPLSGDIEKPYIWVSNIKKFDSIVHVACGFANSMGEIDKTLISSILEITTEKSCHTRFLYTGGVWCFGDTTGNIDEHVVKNPIPEYVWMVENSKMLHKSRNIHSIVIHPANVVTEENSFVPSILKEEYRRTSVLSVPENVSNYWPLVEVGSLAKLYVLALEKGSNGKEFFGCDEPGIKVGELVKELVDKESSENIHEKPISYWIKQYGAWANGYRLSQQISSRLAQEVLGWKPKSLF